MGVCLSQELVEGYVNGTCSADERQAVEAHLCHCRHCQQRIESARSHKNAFFPSDSVYADEEVTKKVTDEAYVDKEELSTKSLSETKAVPYSKRDFAESLESMIEGYKIVEELPRGGQAVVYKAIHTATNTNVAIKVLLPTLLTSARARYYFEREAELIASLDHPNIVSIRDSGIIHGQYYFVMQYVEGQPLSRYVSSQKLSFRERVILFSKICSAISYAHQQGVMHRDLKFGNILVDKRGEPHILDFGLAKAVGASEHAAKEAMVTVTGQWSGSLSTMSPEQAAGQPDLIDVRTDVYSLGVILYHMLTGHYPYEVSAPTLQVLQNIQKAEVVRPRQIIRKFDSDVEAILLTALAKERAERYQSVAELKSDIENWLQGRPIRVRSISTLYLLRKIISRHRYSTTVAALLLLIILSFLSVSCFLYRTAENARQDASTTADKWAAEASKVLILSRQLTFLHFLKAWREGRYGFAGWTARFLTDGSKEKKGAAFLLDPNSLAKGDADFRKALLDENVWFADFILGEYYFKNGNHKEALEAYQRSYQAIRQLSGFEDLQKDGQERSPRSNQLDVYELLEMQVKARLYDLNVSEKPVP